MTPLDPRDIDRLKQLITEQGRILPRQITGLSTKQQRQAVRAIKQARILGFLPFVLTK